MLARKQRKSDFRLKLSVWIVVFALVMFSVFRLALYGLHYELFSSLSAGAVLRAFLNGIRFDFSVISLFIGPFIVLMNLPASSRRWLKTCLYIITSELVVIAGFLTADLIYFPTVKRHIAEEIVQISADWGFVIKYALTQTWLPLLVLVLMLVLAFALINRAVHRKYQFDPFGWIGELTRFILILLVFFLGIRGHLGFGKTLGIADVYRYASSPSAAALTLNGVFTAYQVGRKGSIDLRSDYPAEKAIENTQRIIFSPGEEAVDENYPLMRADKESRKLKDVNVMVVLLEGWHPYYVDSLSGNQFGVTPNFDKIVAGGVNFTNAFAVGGRSVFGFSGVFAGVPLVPGLPNFGYGLELTSFSPMPKHFAQKGYDTFFAQTSNRDSYRLCALASYLGAQGSYGQEDIPQKLSYLEKAPFGYDYDAFMFAADKIKNRQTRNFLAMLFTGITHDPFPRTLPEFDKYPGKTWDDGFKNTLAFADWSIGQLLEKAKTEGWFDNTIFIFVADHTSGGPVSNSLYNKFRVPLVIYAPKIFKARTVEYVVSQLDIVPTLYEMAGISTPYTALGRSLFDESKERVAFVSEGINIGLITAKGAIRHTRKQLLETEKLSDDFDVKQAEEDLLSLDKAAYTLLKENRWYKDEQ